MKMKSRGGGVGGCRVRRDGGAQFTEAAFNQPVTVKENNSWCISSLYKEERMKGEEGKCI